MLPVLDEEIVRIRIAKRIALDLEDGSVVNLGIGIPTLVSDYVPEGRSVVTQTENGVVGAGGRCLSLLPGSSIVASDMSFGLIRGGHLEATVLGALEVDEKGNLANWWIPGKLVPGMGGAMDLVTGAKTVYVATTHCDKKGKSKLVKTCTLPLTGAEVTDVIVTEFCVVRKIDGVMTLCEIAPEVTVEELVAHTDMTLKIANTVLPMEGCK